MGKSIREIILQIPQAEVQGDSDKLVTTITQDSRAAKPGALFVALSGSKVDGHDFINAACEQGAAAVLVEKEVQTRPGVTVIKVPDTRAAMLVIAPYFYDYPSRKLRLIGITGTNGKTTTTHLLRAVLMQAGFRTGLIGTIHSLIDQRVLPMKNTTPDVIELQALFAEMVAEQVEYAIMEVSSHAIALRRISGCEFDVAGFTNLTRDHLDFHITLENYCQTKANLFGMLGADDSVKTGKSAVVNVDDPAGEAMLQKSKGSRTITYGVKCQADIMAQNIKVRSDGAAFRVIGPFGVIDLDLKITGVFNVYNVLAAIGIAWAEGVNISSIKAALESFTSVPGRFELVDAGQPFAVIVDYAHTPDGLENILKTARQIAENRIIVVFGCGGDRDRTKRPIMGKLAMEYGDVVIATSDNPRSEDPSGILQEIEVGLKAGQNGGKGYEIVIDRREAITKALGIANPGDVVIIAGKGHETYQILKDRTIDFDDREIARQIIWEMR
ncbi:MAG: murE 2 [Firmicutes bacterium]|nr:murE 2 [Bacillota bacterium]